MVLSTQEKIKALDYVASVSYGIGGITLSLFVAIIVGLTDKSFALGAAALFILAGLAFTKLASEPVSSFFEGIGVGILAPVVSDYFGMLGPVENIDPGASNIVLPATVIFVGVVVISVVHNYSRRRLAESSG